MAARQALCAVTISLGRYIGQRDDNMIESRKIDFLNGRLLTGDKKKDCTNIELQRGKSWVKMPQGAKGIDNSYFME